MEGELPVSSPRFASGTTRGQRRRVLGRCGTPGVVMLPAPAGLLAAAPPTTPSSLIDARKMAEQRDRPLSERATAAKVAGADSALRLSIENDEPWYTSPLMWGAALGGVATVIALLAPRLPR